MENIWSYTFYNVLKAKPEECAVVTPIPTISPKSTKERIGTIPSCLRYLT